jgi:hypothetical protein
MELLDAHNFAILAAAIVVAFVFIALAWTVQKGVRSRMRARRATAGRCQRVTRCVRRLSSG